MTAVQNRYRQDIQDSQIDTYKCDELHQLVDALLGLLTGQLGNHNRSTQVVFWNGSFDYFYNTPNC